MASLTSLPTELLLQIIENPFVSDGTTPDPVQTQHLQHLSTLLLVSRRFYSLIRPMVFNLFPLESAPPKLSDLQQITTANLCIPASTSHPPRANQHPPIAIPPSTAPASLEITALIPPETPLSNPLRTLFQFHPDPHHQAIILLHHTPHLQHLTLHLPSTTLIHDGVDRSTHESLSFTNHTTPEETYIAVTAGVALATYLRHTYTSPLTHPLPAGFASVRTISLTFPSDEYGSILMLLPLLRLPHLEEASLHNLHLETDIFPHWFSKHPCAVRRLFLRHCTMMQGTFSQILQNCPKLQLLDSVHAGRYFDARWFGGLLRHVRGSLEVLRLVVDSESDWVSDKGATLVSLSEMQRLKVVDVPVECLIGNQPHTRLCEELEGGLPSCAEWVKVRTLKGKEYGGEPWGGRLEGGLATWIVGQLRWVMAKGRLSRLSRLGVAEKIKEGCEGEVWGQFLRLAMEKGVLVEVLEDEHTI